MLSVYPGSAVNMDLMNKSVLLAEAQDVHFDRDLIFAKVIS